MVIATPQPEYLFTKIRPATLNSFSKLEIVGKEFSPKMFSRPRLAAAALLFLTSAARGQGRLPEPTG